MEKVSELPADIPVINFDGGSYGSLIELATETVVSTCRLTDEKFGGMRPGPVILRHRDTDQEFLGRIDGVMHVEEFIDLPEWCVETNHYVQSYAGEKDGYEFLTQKMADSYEDFSVTAAVTVLWFRKVD